MLILTRRHGQGILIGSEVEVVILDTEGGHVRVGIRAPRHISVLRRELRDQVEAENRRAAEASGPDALEGVFGKAGPPHVAP